MILYLFELAVEYLLFVMMLLIVRDLLSHLPMFVVGVCMPHLLLVDYAGGCRADLFAVFNVLYAVANIDRNCSCCSKLDQLVVADWRYNDCNSLVACSGVNGVLVLV